MYVPGPGTYWLGQKVKGQGHGRWRRNHWRKPVEFHLVNSVLICFYRCHIFIRLCAKTLMMTMVFCCSKYRLMGRPRLADGGVQCSHCDLIFDSSSLLDLHTLAHTGTGTSCLRFHPPSPLDNIRVMVIVWRLRGNIIRTALCWIVWHNVHSQQHTYVSSSYRSKQIGFVTLEHLCCA